MFALVENMDEKYSVSVIVPAYRAESTLIAALESVRVQSMKPDEVHIVDDQSPTNDSLLAMKYIRDNDLKGWYVHVLPKNMGAGGARDFGIKACKTSYIAFLDADDIWYSTHLEQAFNAIRQFDLSLFGAGLCRRRSRSASGTVKEDVVIRFIRLNSLLMKCYFLTSTVVLSRASYFNAGGFLAGARLSEDFSLWLRVAANERNRCAVSNQVHAIYSDENIGSTQRLSGSHWAHEVAEISNFKYLRKTGVIGYFKMSIAIAFSVAKYIKRLLVAN
jgi:glycosyltransferase involved in cell wall biosynthesis